MRASIICIYESAVTSWQRQLKFFKELRGDYVQLVYHHHRYEIKVKTKVIRKYYRDQYQVQYRHDKKMMNPIRTYNKSR
ncbi:hypothetical protein C2G38_2094109 [Gigaspora rosea]|uniref:Uncharacterized protein n=1 Tax=Gigaspora rosea TaxID=44941 RepID=A0A397UY17_9GLOM|nr:hypothetical protein C2G38_2094109 [Gigaspora rosea]